ncbi:MAG: hypothetical protein H6Q20_972 [Bacteroidetes bacterium]|nr:hypothetical protein [Bacteroidota bacterium]
MALKNIFLNIAGYSIELIPQTLPIEIETGYKYFVTGKINKPDITIQCFEGIPEGLFTDSKAVFEAENDDQKFYSIYENKDSLGFVIYNQQNKTEIQQVAFLSADFKHWKIYSAATPQGRLVPLSFPMGPIVMQYLTIKNDAVMIHASCVYDGEKGRVFTGFSGNGKSTMSQIWASDGDLIINDDRLIIKKEGNDFFVHNTPMYYPDIPKKAPLSSIYLISHAPENRIAKITGAVAVSRVLAFCIQNNFNEYIINNNLEFISGVCAKTPVSDLGFVPDRSVIDFVLNYEDK